MRMCGLWILVGWVVLITVVMLGWNIIQRRNRRCIFFSLNSLIVALVRGKVSGRDFSRALYLFRDSRDEASSAYSVEFRMINDEERRAEIYKIVCEELQRAEMNGRAYFGIHWGQSDFLRKLNLLLEECGLIRIGPETLKRLYLRALFKLLEERGLRVFAAGVY